MEKITTSAIIEIVGSPVEHVKETMEKIIEMIKSNKDFTLLNKETSEPKEQEFPGAKDKVKIYSTFSEVEVEFKDFYSLFGFCLEFMPSSIEIIKPTDLKISAKDTGDALNDLLARLHQQSRIIMEYTALKRSLNKMKELEK